MSQKQPGGSLPEGADTLCGEKRAAGPVPVQQESPHKKRSSLTLSESSALILSVPPPPLWSTTSTGSKTDQEQNELGVITSDGAPPKEENGDVEFDIDEIISSVEGYKGEGSFYIFFHLNRRFDKQVGNQILMECVEASVDSYLKAQKPHQKRSLVQNLVEKLRARGAVFVELKSLPGATSFNAMYWEELTVHKAVQKVKSRLTTQANHKVNNTQKAAKRRSKSGKRPSKSGKRPSKNKTERNLSLDETERVNKLSKLKENDIVKASQLIYIPTWPLVDGGDDGFEVLKPSIPPLSNEIEIDVKVSQLDDTRGNDVTESDETFLERGISQLSLDSPVHHSDATAAGASEDPFELSQSTWSYTNDAEHLPASSPTNDPLPLDSNSWTLFESTFGDQREFGSYEEEEIPPPPSFDFQSSLFSTSSGCSLTQLLRSSSAGRQPDFV